MGRSTTQPCRVGAVSDTRGRAVRLVQLKICVLFSSTELLHTRHAHVALPQPGSVGVPPTAPAASPEYSLVSVPPRFGYGERFCRVTRARGRQAGQLPALDLTPGRGLPAGHTRPGAVAPNLRKLFGLASTPRGAQACHSPVPHRLASGPPWLAPRAATVRRHAARGRIACPGRDGPKSGPQWAARAAPSEK